MYVVLHLPGAGSVGQPALPVLTRPVLATTVTSGLTAFVEIKREEKKLPSTRPGAVRGGRIGSASSVRSAASATGAGAAAAAKDGGTPSGGDGASTAMAASGNTDAVGALEADMVEAMGISGLAITRGRLKGA